jgi:hypothetical protein
MNGYCTRSFAARGLLVQKEASCVSRPICVLKASKASTPSKASTMHVRCMYSVLVAS